MHLKRNTVTKGKAAAALSLALLLAACASTPPAPVEDISLQERTPPAGPVRSPRSSPAVAVHKVVAGDTLYSIAFKNGLDYRELARINRIESPFRIFVGQELKLADPPPREHAAVTALPAPSAGQTTITALPEAPRRPAPNANADPRAARSAAPPGNERASPTAVSKPPASPVAAATAPPPAVAPAPVPQSPMPAGTAAPAGDPAAVPPRSGALAPGATAAAVAAPVLNSGGVSWRWPASGKVVGTFVSGDQTRQGIDIAGSTGANVSAAADGTVVYSGNGLLGYGELVIVKHSTSFLSAYGHNRKRLVKEGDAVKAGQTIAEMGGSNREMLHFEIRSNGKPVNPLEYLPAR